MDIILALTEELKVEKWQVEAAVKLIDEGNMKTFAAGVKLVSGSTGWMTEHGEEIKKLCTE